MKISVIAKPGAKVPAIAQKDGIWVVAVRERAVDGKANLAVAKAVAAHFGVAPSRVRVAAGLSSRRKIVEIAP